MDDKRTIGRRIRERCEELNIGQAEFGRAIGYKAGTSAWRVMTGKMVPGTEKLILIAKALRMSFEELTGSEQIDIEPETPEERATIDKHIAPGSPARDRRLLLIGLRQGRAEAAARDAEPTTPSAPGSSRPPGAPSPGRKKSRSA